MTNVETIDTAAKLAEAGAHVAPKKRSLKKQATQKKGAPGGQKAAEGGKTKEASKKKVKSGKKSPKTPAKSSKPRGESKAATVVAMISTAKGATLAEIMKSTGWQPHTVRGFVSGTLGKKMGLSVESFKTDSGDRAYRVI